MKSKEVEAFRQMAAQLDALHQEVVAASKKAADKPVTSFKINLANSILANARKILGASAPLLGFEKFDEDDLPTMSDLSFVVTQFVECAEKVKSENIRRLHSGVWYWVIDGEISNVSTSAPRGTR